jgi:transposase InsO family protein
MKDSRLQTRDQGLRVPGFCSIADARGNGYVESFNARLRAELLDGEIFYSLREAQAIIESSRRPYNTVRPHASLGYRPPAPEVFVPAFMAWPAQPQPAAPAKQPVEQRPTMH